METIFFFFFGTALGNFCSDPSTTINVQHPHTHTHTDNCWDPIILLTFVVALILKKHAETNKKSKGSYSATHSHINLRKMSLHGKLFAPDFSLFNVILFSVMMQ